MEKRYRVGVSGDFLNTEGSPIFCDLDLKPLLADPRVEVSFLTAEKVLSSGQLEDIDALILLAQRFDRTSIPKSGRLGIIARFGVGYDTVDLDACNDAGIALVITPEAVRRPVAMSIITLMLALTTKLPIKQKLARTGSMGFAQRSEHIGMGLTGRTFGSLGVGNIGVEAFRLAKPFDMKFIAHDPHASVDLMKSLGVELVDLAELFRRSDVLSISCPLTTATRHIVNAEMLALMKPTSYLINTARGPIVDQVALTRVLESQRIAGAGLDVLEEEPAALNDPLLGLDNVILTPHSLCWTDQGIAHVGALDVQAVLDYCDGRTPTGTMVNPGVLNSRRWKERIDALHVQN